MPMCVCSNASVREVYNLGYCEDLYCRECCDTFAGEACPKCGMLCHVKDATINRQLSMLASLSDDLLLALRGDIPPHESDKCSKENTQTLHISDFVNSPNTGNQFVGRNFSGSQSLATYRRLRRRAMNVLNHSPRILRSRRDCGRDGMVTAGENRGILDEYKDGDILDEYKDGGCVTEMVQGEECGGGGGRCEADVLVEYKLNERSCDKGADINRLDKGCEDGKCREMNPRGVSSDMESAGPNPKGRRNSRYTRSNQATRRRLELAPSQSSTMKERGSLKQTTMIEMFGVCSSNGDRYTDSVGVVNVTKSNVNHKLNSDGICHQVLSEKEADIERADVSNEVDRSHDEGNVRYTESLIGKSEIPKIVNSCARNGVIELRSESDVSTHFVDNSAVNVKQKRSKGCNDNGNNDNGCNDNGNNDNGCNDNGNNDNGCNDNGNTTCEQLIDVNEDMLVETPQLVRSHTRVKRQRLESSSGTGKNVATGNSVKIEEEDDVCGSKWECIVDRFCTSSVTTEKKSGVTTEKKSGVTTKKKSGVVTEKKSGVMTEKKSGVTTEKKSGVATEKKSGLTTEKKSGADVSNHNTSNAEVKCKSGWVRPSRSTEYKNSEVTGLLSGDGTSMKMFSDGTSVKVPYTRRSRNTRNARAATETPLKISGIVGSVNTPKIVRRKATAVTPVNSLIAGSVSPMMSPVVGGVRSPLQASHSKRNAKGETPLHVAAIKGNTDLVAELLAEGANPNIQDNAGWTVLHEAVNHGYVGIARLLLQHGALVNVPGSGNDSPLHDAVANHHVDCTRLLTSWGASLTARNSEGLTPGDYVHSDVMREALNTSSDHALHADQSSNCADMSEFEEMVILGTSLNREQRAQLQKCAATLHARVDDDYTSQVSHIVTSCNTDGQCPRTIKYLQAVLAGKWIISFQWVVTCLEYGQRVSEEAFEVTGTSTNPHTHAPHRARQNRIQQLPGLFDGCSFYFHGTFRYPTPSVDELAALVRRGGGSVLAREPKLSSVLSVERSVPYHAKEGSRLVDCGVFVIYDTDVRHQVTHHFMCTLSAAWLMDSVATFALIDP